MSPLEKAGQLAVRSLPSADDRDALDSLHEDIAAGRVGAVRGIHDRAQAEQLQAIAQERSRLGIPLLFLTETGTGIETIMPAPLSMAASWDMDTIEVAERAVAQEARAHGINWALSPEVTLAENGSTGTSRDCGSEVHLAASVAAARIRGLQADGLRDHQGMLACLDLSDILTTACRRDPLDLLRIARAAIGSAGVGAIRLTRDGGPAREALERAFSFLRGPGGFDGILLSEWDKLERQAAPGENTGPIGVASPDAVADGVKAGRCSANLLDDTAARVLRAKFRLGLLSAAHLAGKPQLASALPTPVRNREIALNLAKRSAILLRNEPRLLPLGIDSGDLVIVGSAASDRRAPLAGRDGVAASVIDGFEQLGIPHRFTPGLALRENGAGTGRMIAADNMAIGMACEAAKRAGTVIFVVGSSEEGRIGEADEKLMSALFAANPNLVVVTLGEAPLDPLVNGRQLPCLLHAGALGTMSGHAVAELLTGEADPSGKLPLELPATPKGAGLPFGHGLTYADFALTDLSIEIGRERICAYADLRNTGEREGVETVQLYLRRISREGSEDASAVLLLVDFQRVRLRPGERETLIFELGRDELGQFAEDGSFHVEAAGFDLFLGLSRSRGMSDRFELTDECARAMAGTGMAAIQVQARLEA
nr:glycoside hydrolase family 3 N-terminal domain-containing protein [Qipengyuania sphaerica]